MTDTVGRVEARVARERHPVLKVFGIGLEVSNPRLAALLTMDAREALTTDVRVLGRTLAGSTTEGATDGADGRAAEAAPERAAEGKAAVPHLPGRRDFRTLVREAGLALGFDVVGDFMWRSPKGILIIVGVVDRSVSFAGASHLVREMDARRRSVAAAEVTSLFVVDDQGTTDVFKVAVRSERLQEVMRTVALDDLMELRRLAEFGVIDHAQALVLLVPMATVDVGELLSIVRTSHVHELPDVLA